MDNVIEMRHITKRFPGIIANDDITLELARGEIHALLGENGAGKSTLMSILFGLYVAEEGEILKDGQVVSIKDPNDANDLGIGMVHQHFKLVECFSALDNIILGAEPMKRGLIDKKYARNQIVELSEKYKLKVDPDALIEDIPVGQQQKVEILKMLYRKNEILIFDEPTAVLTPQEIDELMRIMKGLAAEGKSILFITHKLNEIMAVADRCTILRKGKCIGTVNIADTDTHKLSKMMVGRDVDFVVDKSQACAGENVLEICDLVVKSQFSKKNAVDNVSFKVNKGEIVCIAGIEGNGQSSLVYALTGLEKLSSGKIILDGVDVSKKSIRYRNKLGLAHIPEDRHKFGLILDYSLEDNIVLKQYFTPKFSNKLGFLNRHAIDEYATNLTQKFDVRSSLGIKSSARSMSGGNQQKAILAREISLSPKLLIAVQPTRGLDVGAIEFIHKQIVSARDSGSAVLLISFELDEVMNLSDRILVMYEGEIVGEFNPKTTNVQELGLYMAGSKRNDKETNE
ncbi:MAG: ABC transporter ATP-binding protein [Clostridia bacterium]